MITLYHGTPDVNGQSILNDLMIKVTDKENRHYSDCSEDLRTEFGYVYLTDSYEKAIEVAKNTSTMINNRGKGGSDSIYIFEIKLKKEVLLPDKNECRIQKKYWKKKLACNPCNIEQCLAKTNCVRYSRNIILGAEAIRYKILKSDKNNTLVQDWTII